MPQNIVKLKTERLILRPLAIHDIDTTHAYASDIENTKYMLYLPNYTVMETKQFLIGAEKEWKKEKPSFYEFAVLLNEQHIGAVSVSLEENNQVGELGWIIQKQYQGLGYATEAAAAVLDFSFSILKVNKVVAHCDYRNIASCKVMQKLGLSLERSDETRRNKDSTEDVQVLMYSMVVQDHKKAAMEQEKEKLDIYAFPSGGLMEGLLCRNTYIFRLVRKEGL